MCVAQVLRRDSLPDRHDVIAGPGGVQLAAGGGLSVKANSALNLWGVLGARYQVIGHFALKPLGEQLEL